MSRPSSAQPANLATTERIKSGKQIHSARVSSAKSDKKGLAEEIKDLKLNEEKKEHTELNHAVENHIETQETQETQNIQNGEHAEVKATETEVAPKEEAKPDVEQKVLSPRNAPADSNPNHTAETTNEGNLTNRSQKTSRPNSSAVKKA